MSTSKKIPIYIQIIIAVILGIIFGILFPSHSSVGNFLGKIFLKLLKMLIVPLIFSSIVVGVLSASKSGNFSKLGVRTLIYYVSTSMLAILTGQILVNIIKPGYIHASILHMEKVSNFSTSTQIKFTDTILKMIPENIFKSFTRGEVLPIIFFSILVGFFIGKLKERDVKFLSSMFESLYNLMMKITEFVIKLAPYGIFGLIYAIVAKSGIKIFKNLFYYFLTVFSGIFVHFFITLPLIFFIFTRKNPYKFIKNMLSPLLTAFSTSSSSATLPLTIKTMVEEIGVSNEVAGFVLPLGSTVNMDGTALYECVAVIFIAQVYGIHLSFSQQIIIAITSLLVSIGAAGIPMAGLVMMTIILKAVDLPLQGIGLIIAVDRFLDMFRTATNVFSDSVGTFVIDFLGKKNQSTSSNFSKQSSQG